MLEMSFLCDLLPSPNECLEPPMWLQTGSQKRISRAMKRALILVALFLYLGLSFAGLCQAVEVLIIYRRDIPLHTVMVERLKGFSKGHKDISVRYLGVLPTDPEGPVRQQNLRTGVAVALGDTALKFALSRVACDRGVYLLISNSSLLEGLGRRGKWSGTMLWVPVGIQLAILRDVFPGIRNVGTIVHGPREKALRRELDLVPWIAPPSLKVETLKDPREMVKKLPMLLRDVDAFLFYPDPMVFNSAILQEAVRIQGTFKVPVIVPSGALSLAGASMAIYYNQEKLLAALKSYISGRMTTFDRACCIDVTINKEIATSLGLQFESASQN